MRKHCYLLSAALLLTGAAHAQGTELFFSEYDEGAHQMGVSYSYQHWQLERHQRRRWHRYQCRVHYLG